MNVPWLETGADPGTLWRRRVRFDVFLVVLLFVVMLDRLTGNVPHELLGFVMVAVAALHVVLNRRWCMRLLGMQPKTGVRAGRARRPEGVRAKVVKVVNVLLAVAFAASAVSGAMCSQTLLAGLTPDLWRMDLAYRAAHLGCSMWFFVLTGVHVGLHTGVYAGLLPDALKRLPAGVLLGVVGVLSAVISVRAYVPREADLLFGFQDAFIPVARDEWVTTMPVDLLACFLFAATVTRALDWAAELRSKKAAPVKAAKAEKTAAKPTPVKAQAPAAMPTPANPNDAVPQRVAVEG